MQDVVIYLVPVGVRRFELYSEPPAESEAAGLPGAGGFCNRLMHRVHGRWRDAVRLARRGEAADGLHPRLRDRAIRRTAELISEQRTLWTLRHARRATLVHPSDVDAPQAASARDRIVADARAHHARWLAFDAAAFAASGVLMVIPGPNLIAYYFALRLVGHYLSWRGVRQAASAHWDLQAEPALAELGRLAELPREARAARVDAIAAALDLPSLAAFFDRAAVPARS